MSGFIKMILDQHGRPPLVVMIGPFPFNVPMHDVHVRNIVASNEPEYIDG